MKERLNVYRPILFMLFVAQGLSTIVCAFINKTCFIVSGGLWIVSMAAALLLSHFINIDNTKKIAVLRNALYSAERQSVAAFCLPTLIARENGEIIWNNDGFNNRVYPKDDLFGKNLYDIIPQVDLKEANSAEGKAISVNGKFFTAFITKTKKDGIPLYVLYLVDDNDLKVCTNKYFDSRPYVLSMLIDNYSEIMQDAKENERSKISGSIEREIENFVESNHGILKKIEKDRYFAIIESKYMKNIMSNRFEILNTIHNIDAGTRTNPTLSIGVGFVEGNLTESEKEAQQSLDMALGRGGDQVAVKVKDGFEFYGGISKGIEKQTKVRARIVSNAIIEMVKACDNVVIMGHRYADLDCLGAAAGLSIAIQKIGKPVSIVFDSVRCAAGPLYELFEKEGLTKNFVSPADSALLSSSKTLIIVVDAQVQSMLEAPELLDRCKEIAVIDHHRKQVNYLDKALVFYHEPSASSTCEMVTELLQSMVEKSDIPLPIAEGLLSGIMLDSKNFTMHTGVRTFEAAAFLRKLGADTIEARKFSASDIEMYKLKTKIISNAVLYKKCALSQTDVVSSKVRIVASQAADDMIGLADVEASFVLFAIDDGVYISARSIGNINVQLIMESLGGGGHQNMAAAQLENKTIEETRELIVQAIDKYLTENPLE